MLGTTVLCMVINNLKINFKFIDALVYGTDRLGTQ